MGLTWNKLFLLFAPILINPTPETKMKSAITMFIRENMKAYLEAKYPGYNVTHSSIKESLFQTVKIQFLALGLIDAKLKTTVSVGSEKDIPVCELTNLGKRKLIKLNAIIRK
jgi:hypothetical protein